MAKLKYAGRCSCGKVSYPARKDAKEARKKMKGTGHSQSAVGVYQCQESDYWHLGHMNTGVRAGAIDPDMAYGDHSGDTEQDRLAAARTKVLERSKGRCEVCGGKGVEFSHRRTRAVGGPHQHCACNALWACRGCHDKMHRGPESARALGHHVSRYQPLPFLVPARMMGGWWTLNCNGSLSLSDTTAGRS